MKKKFFITFVIAFIFFAGVSYGMDRVLDMVDSTSKVEFVGHDLGKGNIIEQQVENELLFLVLGLDSDDFSGRTTEHNRTDTMILAKANFSTGEVTLLSIPRDSRVLLRGKYDKINHAHHFGSTKLSMKTTRDFLNLDIDYFVKVNFFSVKDIVNVLGGIEVDVPVHVYVPEDNVRLKPGLQRLNGKQALQFARFRAGYSEGDLGRVKSQQLVIKALIKELTKPKNIVKMPQILEVIRKTVTTNIPFKTIASCAVKANKLSIDKLDANIVPGEGRYIDNISYYVPDKYELKKLIREKFGEYMINGNVTNRNEDRDKNTRNNRDKKDKKKENNRNNRED